MVATATAILLIAGATAAAGTAVFSDGFESDNLSQWTASSGMTVEHQVTYTGSSGGAGDDDRRARAYAYKRLSPALPELYYDGRFDAISQGAQCARSRGSGLPPVV